MMKAERVIAVPCEAPGGLDAARSPHFGHCEYFTLVGLRQGQEPEIQVVENLPHHEGGCMEPVQRLLSMGASDLIVGGIGGRPLLGLQQVGINVYFDGQRSTVGGALDAMLAGELPLMLPHMACGGH